MSMLLDTIASGVIDSSGNPADSGTVYVYQIGTTSPVTIYADSDLSDPISNPVTLSSVGKAEIYVGESVRVVVYDSLGSLIDDYEVKFINPSEDVGGVVSTDIVPSVDESYSLGTSIKRWLRLFAKNIFADLVETETLAAFVPGMTSNLGIALSAGVFSVKTSEGAALSTSDYGFICMPSTTVGRHVILKVSSGGSFNDGNNASPDLTGQGWGITEAVDWDQDVPFFLYAVNRGNADIDGVDGSSAFFIARSPCLRTTPASSDNIHSTSALSGAADTQEDIVLLGNFTRADYVSLPCMLLGAFRMRWLTATDDWFVQTLAEGDGIGPFALDKTFAKTWTMPLNQNGAATGTYFKANGGTAPLFTTNNYTYQIHRDGMITIILDLSGDPGTDGAGAVNALLSLPTSTPTPSAAVCGSARIISAGTGTDVAVMRFLGSSTDLGIYDLAGASYTNANFSNGSRDVESVFAYRGFA